MVAVVLLQMLGSNGCGHCDFFLSLSSSDFGILNLLLADFEVVAVVVVVVIGVWGVLVIGDEEEDDDDDFGTFGLQVT